MARSKGMTFWAEAPGTFREVVLWMVAAGVAVEAVEALVAWLGMLLEVCVLQLLPSSLFPFFPFAFDERVGSTT